MAQFLSTLRDGSGDIDITLSTDGDTLTITDNSNYDDGSPESGHQRAKFTAYRFLVITKPDLTTFTMSTLSGFDQSIAAPSAGAPGDVFTFAMTTPRDGVYKFELYTVPTWNNSDTYELSDDAVWNVADSKLYKAILTNTSSQPDLNPTDWTAIVQSDLTAFKYYATEKVVIIYDINRCLEDQIDIVVCDIEDLFCNDEKLLKDANFVNIQKLRALRDGISIADSAQDFDRATKLVNLATQICNC